MVKTYRKFTLGIALALLSFSAAACSSEVEASKLGEATVVAPDAGSVNTFERIETIDINQNGLVLKILDVYDPATDQVADEGDPVVTDEAANGVRNIAVNLIVDNQKTGSQGFPLDEVFMVQDSTGNQFEPLNSSIEADITNGELAGGANLQGQVVFAVSNTSTDLVLVVNGNTWDVGQTAIVLKDNSAALSSTIPANQ